MLPDFRNIEGMLQNCQYIPYGRCSGHNYFALKAVLQVEPDAGPFKQLLLLFSLKLVIKNVSHARYHSVYNPTIKFLQMLVVGVDLQHLCVTLPTSCQVPNP